jgi:transposase
LGGCWNDFCSTSRAIPDEKTMTGKLSIETINDIEQLRQIALLLEREVEHLMSRIHELTEELARATGKDAGRLQMEIALLQEKLDRRMKELYGASSEKHPKKDGTATQPRQKGEHTGHGPKPQPLLPVVEKVWDLDEADKVCPKCGEPLREMTGACEESEEIDVVQKEYRLVRHKRKKYVCRCGECVETALGPQKLIPGGRYSVDFTVDVAISKYADHQPLSRQVDQMERAGLDVNAQTLWDQLWAMSEKLRPSYEALHAYVLSAPVVGADETTWRMMIPKDPKIWWAWSVTREDAVVYTIQPTRSSEGARQILRDYKGIVVADGYSAYGKLEREGSGGDGPGFTLAKCWAHARRKFIECEPHFSREAGEALEIIGRIYALEAEAKKMTAGMDEPARLEKVAAIRREKSSPIVEEFYSWAARQTALPRSGLGRALGYAIEHKDGLKKFLDDPRIPIDNNGTEREIRPVAVGRKNHYGSRSLRGTQVSALFYSMIESAKMAGLNPVDYLSTALRRAIDNPGTVTLPKDLVPEQAPT